jgi:flagellin
MSINDEAIAQITGEAVASVNAAWGAAGIEAKLKPTNSNGLETFDLATGVKPVNDAGTLIAPTENDSIIIYGAIELSTDSLAGITLGGVMASLENFGIDAQSKPASKSASSGVGSVNLNTASGAQSALTTLDRAINSVTDMRASMGAYQNRLTASIANLENTAMNLSASRSRILDTDYAKETTNLAKSQIIQQAATAMLAQANQSAQSVLALLK